MIDTLDKSDNSVLFLSDRYDASDRKLMVKSENSVRDIYIFLYIYFIFIMIDYIYVYIFIYIFIW